MRHPRCPVLCASAVRAIRGVHASFFKTTQNRDVLYAVRREASICTYDYLTYLHCQFLFTQPTTRQAKAISEALEPMKLKVTLTDQIELDGKAPQTKITEAEAKNESSASVEAG